MKGKPQRQAHRSTNTFTFKGFGEKVRGLRVSAGKFLLQRPCTEEGKEATYLFLALLKARDLNLTQAFQDVQNDLGGDLQSLAQLVHREQHVAECLAKHLAQPETPALQPILDLLVAFASDLPQEFYQKHFYGMLPVLLGQLATREPERLEAVFLCLASLLVVVQRYLLGDLPCLYHTYRYSVLLSPAHPWYINELAAQTLSFLVRKAPGQEAFLKGALRALGQGEGSPQGLGRLLAAMIKSDVIQRLHSSAGQTLSVLLTLLGDRDLPQVSTLECITFAMQKVMHHITKRPGTTTTWHTVWSEDSVLVWPILWQRVSILLPQASTNDTNIHSVMQVVQAWVSYRQAALVTNLSETLTQCLAVVKCQLPEEVGAGVCDVIAVLLTSPHHHTPSKTLHQVIHTLLTSSLTHNTKVTFVRKLFDLPRFDTEVLPEVLQYLGTLLEHGVDQDTQQVLSTLATLVQQKQPQCKTGMDLAVWRPYPLAFKQTEGHTGRSIPVLIEDKIKIGLEENLSNMEELALCLLIVAHVSPLDHQDLAPHLTWALTLLLDNLTDNTEKIIENDKPATMKKKRKAKAESISIGLDLNMKYDLPLPTQRSLALLGVLMEAMVHILSGEDFLACLAQQQLLEALRQRHHYRGNVHFLRALDLYLTVAQAENCIEIVNEETLKEVYGILAPCLASPDPQVRLLVLHIFSLFPVSLPPTPENIESVESVFQIMLKAENVAVTPWEYKNRLRYLSSVDADHVVLHMPVCGSFKEAPLLFLMGQLYINFKDLWEPVLRGIASFAHSIPDQLFWPLWFSKLSIISHLAKEVLKGEDIDIVKDLKLQCKVLEDVLHYVSSHDGFTQIPCKPDYISYRDQLWKAMAKFPDVCEARNRDLVPLFFTFLEEELFPEDFTIAPTQDLTIKRVEANWVVASESSEPAVEGLVNGVDEKGIIYLSKEGETDINKDDEPSEERHDKHTSDKACIHQCISAPVTPRRAPLKSLCEHLALFSKFHNPRMVLQTQRLENMYQELLSHPSPTTQRLALDCIMTYNHPHLTPYKESLYKILDDRSFKHALTLFSIDGSEQSVQEEHRKLLLPCLLRLLYGKMHHKTGANTSGKAKISARKAVVLRFLAGVRETELGTFLDLSFEVLVPHLEGPTDKVVARARGNLNLHQVVPLSRLQSALTTTFNIIDKIGNLLVECVSFLLKVILYVASVADCLLHHRSEISTRNVSFLKHLRQQAQRQVEVFFRRFENYSWSLEELDGVFEAVVWPSLERLPDEGLSSPSPLLGLFKCWAQNPRYLPLLARHHPTQPDLTPLPFVVKILQHPKCGTTVATSVLTLVEDLLTLKDPQEGEEEKEPLPLSSHTVVVHCQMSRDGETAQNYGTALLTPHLNPLLKSLGGHLAKLNQGQAVSSRDLTILTNLTQWISSPEVSRELLSLIMPLLVKKQIKKDEKVLKLLAACCHLLGVVEDPQLHLKPLLSLLAWVGHRQARDHLCQALAVLAGSDQALQELAHTAADLNAWSTRSVEEVDFERRLSRYRTLTLLLASQQSLDLPLCLLLVHHNMFVLQHEDDAALRDVAVLCLTQLVDLCVRLQETQPAVAKQVVVDRLLPQVRGALQGEREVIRLEAMAVLRHVVHACHNLHPQIADLHQLADCIDEESDFFSNMKHIQRHRRARALSRLADKLTAGTITLTTYTMTEYIIPMATVYLFKDEFVNDDFLMTSCVATLGAVSRQLPWFPYQKLLKNYLGVLLKEDLKHLRLGVKVIDVILDGFHEEVEECGEPWNRRPGKRETEDHQEAKKSTHTDIQYVTSGSEVSQASREKGRFTTTKKMSIEENYIKEKGIVLAEKDKDIEMEEEKGKNGIEEEGGRLKKEDGVKEEGGISDKKDSISFSTLTHPQKVYRTLVGTIIPQIQRTLGTRTKADIEHKVNRSKYPEDEDIKRIPLAFALIKLLKKLPKKVLNANVNNVLMKIITFHKCKAEGIREEARNMLVRIMVELGGQYLPWLVNDLRSILTKGFQSHVLVYTLYAVLSQLRPSLAPAHVDSCITQLVEVCKEDILGIQAEEKKVSQITSKVKEARSDRGYDILRFTAEFMSAEGLREVMVPLSEVLAHTHDRMVVSKMARCLAKIAAGLERNQNISIMQKSVFVYGMLNEKLPEMTADWVDKKAQKNERKKADSFLLPPEPKRARLNPKTSLKTTAHVLIDFTLQLLCSLMRRGQLVPSDPAHVALLDPYIVVMSRCITSDHPEVSIQALKCVNWLVKFPLPSLQKELKKICGQMFILLHKYSSPELAYGKLFDLVQLSFKTLAVVVRNVESFMLTKEEVEVLLGYVEDTLEDSRQQQTAFTVLQAVLTRKVDVPCLHKLLQRVKEMSITSSRQYPLQQARVTYHTYILTYPVKPRQIMATVQYFLDNVSYQVEEGRVSATTMINAVVANFPAKLINRTLETNLWFRLSEQLVKEHSKENRSLLHKGLKCLFERSTRQEMLVGLCMKLLTETKEATPDHIALQLASKSLCAFLDVPVKQLPKTLLSEVMPHLVTLIHPTRFTTQVDCLNHGSLEITSDIQLMDTTLTGLLEVLSKLVEAFMSHPEWKKHVKDELWENIQSHLSYPHLHVRVIAAGVVGQLLAAHPVDGDTSPPSAATSQKARELAGSLCELLRTQAGPETPMLTQLSLSAVRNLIYLIRHAVKVPLVKRTTNIEDCMREGKKDQEDIKGHSEESEKLYSNSNMSNSERRNITNEEVLMDGRHRKTLGVKIVNKSKENSNNEGSEGMDKEDIKSGKMDADNETPTEGSMKINSETHKKEEEEWDTAESKQGVEGGGTSSAVVDSAVWVLHRVGDMAYEELQMAGTQRTGTREALLNLMAGLLVVVGSDVRTPKLFTYIIKHLARELTDEHLPETLKERTREVASLVREKVGVESYTRHLAAAQTALARKRLGRKAKELQEKVFNPHLAQQRKRKKQEALKESRKKRIAERKGRSVKGKGAQGKGKSKGGREKKPKVIDEVVVRE